MAICRECSWLGCSSMKNCSGMGSRMHNNISWLSGRTSVAFSCGTVGVGHLFCLVGIWGTEYYSPNQNYH
eukprot:5595480-Amphidinium_carterae.1